MGRNGVVCRLRMTALRPVIVVRSSVQKPATSARRDSARIDRPAAAAPEFVFGGECDAAAFLAIRLGDPFVHLRPEEAVRDGDLGKMIVHDIQSKRRVFRALASSEGAAGSIVENISKLECTIDPNEIKKKDGVGAERTFETGQ
jgi:hypothetical protein